MYGVQEWFESPVQPAITQRLGSMGSPNQLNVDMPNGTTLMFYGITPDLDTALRSGGRPKRPDLTVQGNIVSQGYYIVNQFQGGWLLDNCPLNVIFGQGWLPGQQQALAQAGLTPSCPQVTGQPVMSAPAPIQQATSPIPSQTYVPPLSTTLPGSTIPSAIITGSSPAAPNTPVFASSGPGSPTGMNWQDQAEPGGGGGAAPALPQWTFYAAIALIGVLALRGRGK